MTLLNTKSCRITHMKKTETADTSLADILPFWKDLTASEKELITANARLYTFKAKENIHSGIGDCTGIIAVRSGRLRTYIFSSEGKEITINRLSQGDVCILSASCILKNISFDIRLDAEKDSEIYIIRPTAFDQLKQSNIHVSSFVNAVMNERFSDSMWVIEQILFMSFDKRLAIFLLDQSVSEKSDVLHFTHDEIARHLGSAREVISRMLKYFENEEMVSLSRGTITLTNKKKLRDLTM